MVHPQKNYSSCLRNSQLSSKKVSLALPSLELLQAEIAEDQLDVPTHHIYVNYRLTNHQDLCDSYYKNTHLIFTLFPLLALSQTTNSLSRLHRSSLALIVATATTRV